MDLLFAAVIILAASFVAVLTGFGFFLVTTPLLVLVMSAKSAVILSQLLCLVIGPLTVWSARRHVDRGLFATLLLASLVGMPLGAYVLLAISDSMLRLGIGAMVVATTVALLLNYSYPIARERLAAVGVGFLSGVLTTSSSIGGPPAVIFLANQRLPKDSFRGTTAAFLFTTIPFSVAMLSVAGLVTGELLTRAVVLSPACVLGYLLAIRLLPAIKPGLFRRLTVLLVLATGLLIVASEVGRVVGG